MSGSLTKAKFKQRYAREVILYSISAARISNVVDLPATAFEILTGLTFDITPDLDPALRKMTDQEKQDKWIDVGMMAAASVVTLGVINPAKLGRAIKGKDGVEYVARKGLREHITRGKIKQESSADTTKYVIAGGMHTKAGREAFEKVAQPDQLPTRRIQHDNGVVAHQYPPAAMEQNAYKMTERAAEHGRGVPGGKTSFPDSWTEDKIMEAIEEVLRSPTTIKETGVNSKIITGVVDEVVIDVAVSSRNGNNNIGSAYPAWDQWRKP